MQRVDSNLETVGNLEIVGSTNEDWVLAALDRWVQGIYPSLGKEILKMLSLLLGRLDTVNANLIQRVPHLLHILSNRQALQQSSDCLVLLQSYLIVHHKHFQHDSLAHFCTIVEHNYYNLGFQTLGIHLKAHLLIEKMIRFLMINSSGHEQVIGHLVDNFHVLNFSCWTNQVSLYLISHLIMRVAHPYHQLAIKTLLSITIPLLDSRMKNQYTCSDYINE